MCLTCPPKCLHLIVYSLTPLSTGFDAFLCFAKSVNMNGKVCAPVNDHGFASALSGQTDDAQQGYAVDVHYPIHDCLIDRTFCCSSATLVNCEHEAHCMQMLQQAKACAYGLSSPVGIAEGEQMLQWLPPPG